MSSSVLPISNVINVTIQDTPSGLNEPNVNSLALFTNEVPIGTVQPYYTYVSPAQVAEDWGTNSVTAAMANNIFAQTPNILSGDGRLVVIPLRASVSATAGQSVTANISANLAAILAISNGDLRVTINGVANNLHGLNFTGCLTLADVAAVIDSALPAGVNVTGSGTALTFQSDKVGSTSTVALAANAAGGTDLTGAGLFNTAAATNTGGANSSGETILAAISRTSGQVGYCPVMTNLNLEDAVIESTAVGIQALDNIFLHHVSSIADIAGIATTVQQATQKKTRILPRFTSQAEANLYKAAYAGRGFSVNFDGSLTASTMNLKSLVNVTPDPGVTQTIYAQAGIAGADIYVSYQGVPCVYSTGGNDYFDNVYCDLALKFALETAGFNYLRQTNTKVPQTEPAMNGLKAAYALVMDQFVTNGELAPGAWNSSETFGNDPQTFKNNVANSGYYIYSAPVALQSASDRDNRKAPLVQIAAKRAGAIHSSTVIVIINN